jgi:hypothetical protein
MFSHSSDCEEFLSSCMKRCSLVETYRRFGGTVGKLIRNYAAPYQIREYCFKNYNNEGFRHSIWQFYVIRLIVTMFR